MKKKYFVFLVQLVLIIAGAGTSWAQTDGFASACKAKYIYNTELGGEVNFEAIVSSGTNSFEWDFGDNSGLLTAKNEVSHVYKKPGVYEACVKTTDSLGCQKTVCKKVIPSFSSPCSASFLAIANGLSVDFVCLTQGADGFEWTFGDGQSGSGKYVSHTYNSYGHYTIRLIISDSKASCTDTAYVQYHLNGSNCSADYTFNKDSTGGVWFYSSAKPAGVLHFWEFGDGATSKLINPVHQYRAAGVFNVQLIINDTVNACADTIIKQVQIAPPPKFDVRGRVSVGGSFATDGLVYLYEVDSIQQRYHPVDTVRISASPVTGEYRFRNVGIGDYLIKGVLGKNDPKYGAYLPSYAGTQNLYWNINASMRVANSTSSYNIDLVPGRGTAGPGKIKGRVFDGSAGALKGTSKIPLLLLDAQQNPVATVLTNQNGEYEFPSVAYGLYMLTLDWPGSKQVYKVVILNPNRPVSTSNDFIHGGGSIALGEEELAGNELILYPNPVRDRLSIGTQGFDRESLSIQVLSVEGRVVLQGIETVLGKDKIELELSALPDGLYLVRIHSGSRSFYGRFIKY